MSDWQSAVGALAKDARMVLAKLDDDGSGSNNRPGGGDDANSVGELQILLDGCTDQIRKCIPLLAPVNDRPNLHSEISEQAESRIAALNVACEAWERASSSAAREKASGKVREHFTELLGVVREATTAQLKRSDSQLSNSSSSSSSRGSSRSSSQISRQNSLVSSAPPPTADDPKNSLSSETAPATSAVVSGSTSKATTRTRLKDVPRSITAEDLARLAAAAADVDLDSFEHASSLEHPNVHHPLEKAALVMMQNQITAAQRLCKALETQLQLQRALTDRELEIERLSERGFEPEVSTPSPLTKTLRSKSADHAERRNSTGASDAKRKPRTKDSTSGSNSPAPNRGDSAAKKSKKKDKQ